MAVRIESAPFHLVRRLTMPAAVGALIAAVIAAIRRRAGEPSVPRMSDEWLRSQGTARHEPWR